MNIAGSAALVTGGASALGLATARKLHGQGASVVILDLPSSQGGAVAKELGDRVIFCPGDVTSADDVAAAATARRSVSTAPSGCRPANAGQRRRVHDRTATK